jgi:hypothetical protein
MAEKPLSIRDFLDVVEAAYLAAMDGDCGQHRRVWSLLQVHFGNPDVHWEVWPQRKTGRIEVGLHFEAEREKSYEWAARLGEFAGLALAELGPRAELEEWTPSWTRVHETLEFTALSPGLAEEVAQRLVVYVSTLRPLLDAAGIPFTTAPPARPRPPQGSGRWSHRRRRRTGTSGQI